MSIHLVEQIDRFSLWLVSLDLLNNALLWDHDTVSIYYPPEQRDWQPKNCVCVALVVCMKEWVSGTYRRPAIEFKQSITSASNTFLSKVSPTWHGNFVNIIERIGQSVRFQRTVLWSCVLRMIPWPLIHEARPIISLFRTRRCSFSRLYRFSLNETSKQPPSLNNLQQFIIRRLVWQISAWVRRSRRRTRTAKTMQPHLQYDLFRVPPWWTDLICLGPCPLPI